MHQNITRLQITWVKKTSSKNLAISQGYYFLHSTEICLIGVKCAKGKRLEYISRVNNDIMFAQVRRKTQKPDELYHIIELMVPGKAEFSMSPAYLHYQVGERSSCLLATITSGEGGCHW